MAVGCNNGVVGLVRLSNKEMTGLSLRTQKSGGNNGLVRPDTVEPRHRMALLKPSIP